MTKPNQQVPTNMPSHAAGSTGLRQPRSVKRTRHQHTIIVYGILSIVLVLVVMQLWLLTATMNAFLGGDDAVIWPAAGASTVCLLLNIGLLVYLYRMERP